MEDAERDLVLHIAGDERGVSGCPACARMLVSMASWMIGNGGLKLTPWRRNRFDPSTAFKERFASHLPPSREIAIGTLDGEF